MDVKFVLCIDLEKTECWNPLLNPMRIYSEANVPLNQQQPPGNGTKEVATPPSPTQSNNGHHRCEINLQLDYLTKPSRLNKTY